ncbi:GIY-YIG nuclease family protein, partial [Klebsiella pneumoniae]|uniref:GIY-YIG nuclease family protein n=1 Tax=Klebsiella pneumoniae TaxID=573 RepID=UPI0037C17394
RVFAYVFPCAWEDYAKSGFSRDPLGRISALHRRWFEFFDLDAGALVEAESERDARDLELQLRSPFKAHRAPAPMTVQDKAGGRTEWVRGANHALSLAVAGVGEQGYRC